MADLDLRLLVATTAPADLPALCGRLREAELLAEMRLREEASPEAGTMASSEPDRWITAREAADIVGGVTVVDGKQIGVTVERIYSWAKGQRWASRPSRRCLRIEERAFRRWLASKSR